MFVETIISVSIPAIVTIIGFILTYHLTARNLRDELSKQKTNIQLERMSAVPYEILQLFDNMVNASKGKKTLPDLSREMQGLFSKIYAYGSTDAIRILAAMQKENYTHAAEGTTDPWRQMSYYVLLASQIKFDTTGIAVSSSYWFEIRLIDFASSKKDLSEANNKLVNELKLNRAFLMEAHKN
jgi:hypothetical protein